MAQDNAPNKPVHLIYLCSGLLMFFLLQWTADWIWGYFTKNPSEFWITLGAAAVALGTSIYFYRDEKTYNLVNEVASELKKVTWPGSKEVKAATLVVVIMTILSALILGVFDLVWSEVTHYIYG